MVIQETLETNVTADCDVLVCGGGIGGISAALAAARLGRKVLLLEKQFMLGGLGTAGLVTIYLPLCDGCGRQVSFGIAEELLRLSVSMGYEEEFPHNWLASSGSRTRKDRRFEVQYNPQLFAILAEQLLLDSGVRILYGSYAVGVSMEDDKIGAVILENKSGRQAVTAKTVVEATGDCDIAHFAGAPTENFQQGNSLAAWYYSLGQRGYKLNVVGVADIPEDQKTEGNKVPQLVPGRFTGLSGEELSKMMQLSHAATLEHLLQHRQADDSLVPTAIATTPQVRMTRRLRGGIHPPGYRGSQVFPRLRRHGIRLAEAGPRIRSPLLHPVFEGSQKSDHRGPLHLRYRQHVGRHAGNPLLRRHRAGRRHRCRPWR